MDERKLRQRNHAAKRAIAHYGDGDTTIGVRADELEWMTDILIGALDRRRAKQQRQANQERVHNA